MEKHSFLSLLFVDNASANEITTSSLTELLLKSGDSNAELALNGRQSHPSYGSNMCILIEVQLPEFAIVGQSNSEGKYYLVGKGIIEQTQLFQR